MVVMVTAFLLCALFSPAAAQVGAVGSQLPSGAPLPVVVTSSFTDSRDGQKYRTVKIGNQTWMAENLNYKTGQSYCYDNDESNCKKYGRLYDWNTAKRVCPRGWHLPSRGEWDTLVVAVGGEIKEPDGPYDPHRFVWYSYDVGKKLKSKAGWEDYGWGESGNGTDEFGFSALPGGSRHPNGSFHSVGNHGEWWVERLGLVSFRFLYDGYYLVLYDTSYEENLSNKIYLNTSNKNLGCSVRCLRD